MDVAVVALEIQTQRLLQQTAEAEAAFRRLEAAGDRTGTGSRRNARDTDTAAAAHAKAAREASQYAQAQARLARVSGDYGGAVQILNAHLKTLSASSVEYVRIQAQIASVQAQAGRAMRGENFAGFAASLKNINQNLVNLPGQLGSLIGRAQGVAAAFGVTETSSLALIGAFAGVAVGAALVAKGIYDLSLQGAAISDQLTDMASATGLTVEQLSLLKIAASASGSSITEVESAFNKFATVIEEVSQGRAPRAAAVLKSLGIDAKKAGEDGGAAFFEFNQQLVKIQDPLLRIAIAREFEGRAGGKQIAVWKDLIANQAEYGKQGLIVSTSVAEASGKVDDALKKLDAKFDVVKQNVSAFFAPVIIGAFEAIGGSIDGVLSKLGKLDIGALGALFNASIGGAPPVTRAGSVSINDITGGGSTARLTADARRAFGTGAGTGSGSRAGSSALPKISPGALGEVNAIEAAARFKREGMGQIVDAIVKATDDIATQRQILGVRGVAGTQQAKSAMEALAKAIATLPKAVEAFLRATADALTAANRRVPLAGPLGEGVPGTFGGPAFGNIPGPGGTSGNAAINKLLALGPVPGGLTGGIPGVPTKFEREAPKPSDILPAFKGQLKDAGAQLTEQFLFGILSGRESLKEAGANMAQNFADFFARYASRKLTEFLQKELDAAFSALGGLLNSLLQGLLGGGGSGFFGKLIGAIAGGAAGAAGGGGGGFHGGGVAGGGYVMAGGSYLVGEAGPERFTPAQSGYITSNARLNAEGAGWSAPIVHLTVNIASPDADSFRKARTGDQVADSLLAAMQRASRNR